MLTLRDTFTSDRRECEDRVLELIPTLGALFHPRRARPGPGPHREGAHQMHALVMNRNDDRDARGVSHQLSDPPLEPPLFL